MSLRDARMPSLKDKLEEQALEVEKAEKLREKKEKEDEDTKKVIKKSARKN